MEELEVYINSYFGISSEHLQKISSLFEITTLDKEAFFCQSDQHCPQLSFVRSGMLRVFDYVDGKEITQWLISPGEFAADLSSIIFKQAARWNIQAVAPCEMYTIKADNYRKIGQIVPQWQELEKLFIAKCFITLENRVFTFLSMSAEERYYDFFEKKPELFNSIPLHYIASMLGMTPETLSRIRKKRIS